LIAPSVLVFEFHEVDQTSGKSKKKTPDSEMGNGCKCSLTHCRGEVLDHVLKASAISDPRISNDQLVQCGTEKRPVSRHIFENRTRFGNGGA
jgi:hypothetical protein